MRKIRLQKSGDDRLAAQFAADLNRAQHEAATAPDGFNLILAGPGSGKTRVITYRVAYLIARGVPAESILLVTFTRRAAREMVGRLEALIGPRAAKVWAGTFHHIGNRLLRRSAQGPRLRRRTSRSSTARTSSTSSAWRWKTPGSSAPAGWPPSRRASSTPSASRSTSGGRSRRSSSSATPTGRSGSPTSKPPRRPMRTGKKPPTAWITTTSSASGPGCSTSSPTSEATQAKMFRHLLIDEMQDTNTVQADLIETLAREGSGNLTAVGDDAQSIYKFRGANYDNILKFPERNPGTNIFRLETNYRSTPEIVAFTNASIAHNASGFPKTLVSARGTGPSPWSSPPPTPTRRPSSSPSRSWNSATRGSPSARWPCSIATTTTASCCRPNWSRRGVPYTVRSGLRFFEQAHIKDVLAYCRILANPRDEPAWRRLLLLLPGIGPAKASAICNRLIEAADPLAALATAETMALVPAKSKGLFAGFVADLRKVEKTKPETHPADAIAAILKGGYPETVRARYERPDNRIADIEQLAVLASRYDSLERLIADLMLAGDVYGVDGLDADDSTEHLVLSTIHQAKGLEWSRVFVPRLVDEGFPSAPSPGRTRRRGRGAPGLLRRRDPGDG